MRDGGREGEERKRRDGGRRGEERKVGDGGRGKMKKEEGQREGWKEVREGRNGGR